MEVEEERKRGSEETGEVYGANESPAVKRQREADTTAESTDDNVMGWLSMEGCSESETDSMSELLKLLDDSAEATTSASSYSSTSSPRSYCMSRVRFSDNPYSSALVFQSSSSYITINGNEESCGSSFSDSESSVMASVDMGGIFSTVRNVEAWNGLEGIRKWLEADEGSAWDITEESARGWMMDWEREGDEEQLARFLGEEDECLF